MLPWRQWFAWEVRSRYCGQVSPIVHVLIGYDRDHWPLLVVEFGRDYRRRYELLTWSPFIVLTWESVGNGYEARLQRSWAGPCWRHLGLFGFSVHRWSTPKEGPSGT